MMSNHQLPQAHVALSELLTPKKSTVSLDIDGSIDEANQNLLDESFSEVNPESQTHTPYYNTGALAQALGTDQRAFRKAVAEADRDEVRHQNDQTFLSQGLTLEIIDERYEQPRDAKQQAKHEATSQLIADVAAISYQTVVKIGNQQKDDA
ncbi:hypothetical protein [Vibrio ezurae]|uniref:Uncharacterized protein n=1 Tax=Vibrio ezurae NBRC 102218 TaxID=1219080 RepID=U3CCT4_9VIBR|nr:hypothetical protein [Vibrio ezurae]GAD79109.1 hypothetical protein VEZ01S_08_01450 [Vibrio ezurae NBRC 102218]